MLIRSQSLILLLLTARSSSSSSSSIGGLAHPLVGSTTGPCPYQLLGGGESSPNKQQYARRSMMVAMGDGGNPEGGYQAVMADLKILMTDSQEFWPADFAGTPHGPHYGGLFIRLAWHCSGSYRQSDGRGGCDGGRIRFEPELKWPDNGNLDKALQLLVPIKEKYGSSLSWGDLIILSGTTAIEYMGGPNLGFCGGRVDDADGAASLQLGPSPEQEAIGPCQSIDMQGSCLAVEGTALGPTTVGLIYVNPEGPKGQVGNTTASAADIRLAFGRMGFNDVETVSLIGGGHAFGKAHGACETPPCGAEPLVGLGPNAVTSGLEGVWTSQPTKWTNEYFSNLFDLNYTLITGPGGASQYAPLDGTAPSPDIFMLTSDLALRDDPEYATISKLYRDDIATLEEDFAKSWYRLTTQDMGPVTRCMGDLVPEAQPFQHALPASPATLPDYVPVRSALQELLTAGTVTAPELVNLAYRCASTYRVTDHFGGCNGARIRFEPEKSWPTNAGTSETLAKLQPVQTMYSAVSTADLIVLAGITALGDQKAGGLKLPFCGGYVDAADGTASEYLAPRLYPTAENPDYALSVMDDFQVKGLTKEEGVVLACREKVGSQYFVDLKAGNGDFDELEEALLDDEFIAIVDQYAADDALVKTTFATAWTKMMTADRHGTLQTNVCDGVSTATLETDTNTTALPGPGNAVSTPSGAASVRVCMTMVMGFVILLAYWM